MHFTLAHELSHFVFHRDVESIPAGEDGIPETDNDLELDHVQGRNRRDWLEWQANKFAAALLLPRRFMVGCVLEFQQPKEITRNIGQIHVDYQPQNLRDWDEIAHEMCNTYTVSKSCLRRRLRVFRGELVAGSDALRARLADPRMKDLGKAVVHLILGDVETSISDLRHTWTRPTFDRLRRLARHGALFSEFSD
jgi:Zn-dependent peptidase ImmA (M78 family)